MCEKGKASSYACAQVSLSYLINKSLIQFFFGFWYSYFFRFQFLLWHLHMMTSSNWNIFRVTGPLCGNSPVFVIDGWGIYRNIVLKWMSVECTDDKTALAQIMVWCVRQQAITHANDDLDPYCYTASLGDNELRWGHDFLCLDIFIYSIGLYWGLAIHLTHIIYGCFNGIRVITCSTNEVTHHSDVIMGSIASQITSIMILYSSVYSGAAQKKTSKLRVTGLRVGNSSETGKFPAQRTRHAENVSIW